MKRAADNKWLTLGTDVILTPVIEPVIVALDPFFGEDTLKAQVTSGLRTPSMQLRIIRKYAKKHGVDAEYPEILSADVESTGTALVDGETIQVYDWQRAWSRLLEIGIVVNPPLLAKCLAVYMRDGVNMKNRVIGASPHFKGTAFDIGGGDNSDVTEEVRVMHRVILLRDHDKSIVPGFKGMLVERKNNCVHVDCEVLVEGLAFKEVTETLHNQGGGV